LLPIEQRFACARRQRAALVLAAQETLRQRRIGEQPHLFAHRNLGEPDLEGAVDQTVGVLNRLQPRPARSRRLVQERHRSPRRLIRQSDPTNFARLHVIVERAQDVGDDLIIAFSDALWNLEHPEQR